MLRGVQAAGVALCYGNNNGGACAARSAHPLAPSVAQSSPWLFSCPARLCNRPSLPSPFIYPLLSCDYPNQASLSVHVSLIFLSSILPTLSLYPCLLFFFSSTLSSQFHPFFCPTKTSIHSWHLEGLNKTSSENAKPAQKCHRCWDFCFKICSRSPRQTYFVFLIHCGVTVFHRPCVGEG